MDGNDAPRDADAAPEPAKNGRARAAKPPTWASAIPAVLNLDDELETTATIGHRAVTVALAQVLAAKGMKVRERVQLVTQLTAQMPALIAKRRLWEAERLIKGEAREMNEAATGPQLEDASGNVTGTNSSQQASRPAARRGRPRKRPLL